MSAIDLAGDRKSNATGAAFGGGIGMRRKRRLLSIAHSYCVALNRRLAHEMAIAGGGEWEVTAVAPEFIRGDLRPISLEAAEGEACRLEPVPVYLSRHIHLMFYGRRLREILREKWDLVHCWQEPYILVGSQVARWTQPDTTLVYLTYQNMLKQYPPPFSWLERYAMNRASGWIAGASKVESMLLQRPEYASRPRKVIPLGVDTGHFRQDPATGAAVRARLGWSEPGPPVVGYLGRFVPQKGVEFLTQALDQVRTPWRALFVGAGPQEPLLRRWAAPYGDRVRIVPAVRHDEVPVYLNAMDVLCAPSQTMPDAQEQLGRMVIEAFACGVPVIASDSGEIPHVVDGAGVIVAEKNLEAWTRALETLLDDDARRIRLGAAGLERADSVYSWRVVAKQYLEFFDELVGARTDGR